MAVFQHRHHAQAEQVDFDNAHVGAVFFVPLHHDAARHGRRLKRHHRVKLSLADHHAAGMLPEVTRQVLHRQAKLEELAHARMPQIEAGIAELALQRVAGIFVFPRTHQAGEAVERFAIEAERLAHLARRRVARDR